ncbi:hypothetical protein CHS0354_002480 [Potamilus streckersoni]|uniref:Selenoprotein K n=1 Tax=Potamilus streckersoni TaxID=2493646 RepID=A0AAE0T9M5_9BIVA|nr:hypothetical protein CHS0354_002480 [Potamilus streckersoni]
MVYISDGQVKDSQTLWRVSIIPDIFWAIINFIVLFFQTLISPGTTKHGKNHTSDYRSGQGPPKPPRRRMGGFGGGGGAPSPPPMAGGG